MHVCLSRFLATYLKLPITDYFTPFQTDITLCLHCFYWRPREMPVPSWVLWGNKALYFLILELVVRCAGITPWVNEHFMLYTMDHALWVTCWLYFQFYLIYQLMVFTVAIALPPLAINNSHQRNTEYLNGVNIFLYTVWRKILLRYVEVCK